MPDMKHIERSLRVSNYQDRPSLRPKLNCPFRYSVSKSVLCLLAQIIPNLTIEAYYKQDVSKSSAAGIDTRIEAIHRKQTDF